MVDPERWEHGSEFHWFPFQEELTVGAPWLTVGRFYATGRDAFRSLIELGCTSRNWRRIWVPSYFCQDVTATLLTCGVDILVYPDDPTALTPDFNEVVFRQGDVLLWVNFFGLRTPPSWPAQQFPAEIIEDHTHDPWSVPALTSEADWCLASLRKTLPISDGAVLWSPRGHALPQQIAMTSERRIAALHKMAAIWLKGAYLEGRSINKDTFRRLALAGEAEMGLGTAAGMSEWSRDFLSSFPVHQWREARRTNHAMLSEVLRLVEWVRVLQPVNNSVCPFSNILVLPTPRQREALRSALLAAHVYPAILWNLEQPLVADIPEQNVDFSRRMLSVHCDMRYTPNDMQKIGALILKQGHGTF